MYPFLREIHIDKQTPVPVYIQMANQLVSLIKQGILKPGFKLPGSRILAEELSLHRQTVVAGLEELILEGWLVAIPKKGTFVSDQLPDTKAQKLQEPAQLEYPSQTGFELKSKTHLEEPIYYASRLQFNDGCPDVRLAPIDDLARMYASVLRSKQSNQLLNYGTSRGEFLLKEAYASMLNQHRGLKIKAENVFITRGSIMGMYLLSRLLLEPGDYVAVGESNYRTADICFQNAGARLLRVRVDGQGLDVDDLSKLCERHTVRAIYVNSHHHHPTSVTLSPERRMRLLELANIHRFAIIEDDYDFDFHYQHRPILPLASADQEGLVLYIGSLSKILSPAIRIGFLIAPKNLIEELSKYRRLLDRQGDMVLERSIAHLLMDGTIRRFTKKALKIYRERRDFFCKMLREEFSEAIHFQEPEGGLAVWAKFAKEYPLSQISQACKSKNLHLSDGSFYSPIGQNLNACRMGFASMNQEEMIESLEILKTCMFK